MHSRILMLLLCLSASAASSDISQLRAQETNPEDAPLTDEPVPTVPEPATPTTDAPEAPVAPANTTPDVVTVEPPSPSATSETVTVPRAVWERLLRDVEELKAARAAAPSVTAGENTETSGDSETSGTSGRRNYLLLPDISVIGQAKGLYSSDRRDDERRRTGLAEAEIAIQGFVYPNVKAELYIVGAPGEDEPLGVEEGFLTFLGVRKNLNVWLGRKFTPFSRTGEQHNHSWMYARQLLPFRNLVAEEALIGDGFGFRYTLPTGKKLFTNLAVGYWSGEGAGEISSNPFGDDLETGPGAGFDRRFLTARLWSAYALSENSELELGTSYARGGSQVDDDSGAIVGRGKVRLMGFDASYRRFFAGGKRLLLRSEYFGYKPDGFGGGIGKTNGYYGLANYRFDQRKDIGLLYENSGFPQSPNQREKALSLIYTKQFTEQFYARLMATRGDRPGMGSYNEARVQFTFGLGPHTHNLE